MRGAAMALDLGKRLMFDPTFFRLYIPNPGSLGAGIGFGFARRAPLPEQMEQCVWLMVSSSAGCSQLPTRRVHGHPGKPVAILNRYDSRRRVSRGRRSIRYVVCLSVYFVFVLSLRTASNATFLVLLYAFEECRKHDDAGASMPFA